VDEFDEIARLFRPLTGGADEALGLLDDAAAVPQGDGSWLVVTTDTVVEGVHVPVGEAPELIARKLVRVNLSDLAAKGAEPYGAFLNLAWPQVYDHLAREAFASGIKMDLEIFKLPLFGGDTVRTPGPLVATLTALGRCPKGGFVARAGAQAGDVLLVSGTIGDATLGLDVALGRDLTGVDARDAAALLHRYRLPQPRLALRSALRSRASAAADVSDGLLADAGRIALASGLRVEVDLGAAPLSAAARAWLAMQPDEGKARLRLATGGDDYEIVCACPPAAVDRIMAGARATEAPLTVIGRFVPGQGVGVRFGAQVFAPDRLGYAHL
jgi:thiamine-monophosphate kinase